MPPREMPTTIPCGMLPCPVPDRLLPLLDATQVRAEPAATNMGFTLLYGPDAVLARLHAWVEEHALSGAEKIVRAVILDELRDARRLMVQSMVDDMTRGLGC